MGAVVERKGPGRGGLCIPAPVYISPVTEKDLILYGLFSHLQNGKACNIRSLSVFFDSALSQFLLTHIYTYGVRGSARVSHRVSQNADFVHYKGKQTRREQVELHG